MNNHDQLKYQQIYEYLREKILTGRYEAGNKIPTQRQLARQFEVSRPTVARALRDLETEGVLVSRQGAGTFVHRKQYSKTGLLGLITVNTPGNIGRIAEEISEVIQDRGYSLLWGTKWPEGVDNVLRHCERLCELYRSRDVAGVFFTPLSETPEQALINQQIVETIYKADIQVVLLDRDICDYPYRSKYDLVGVDNFNIGLTMTRHLFDMGYERIEFITNLLSASTITARIAGYRHAFIERGLKPSAKWIHREEVAVQSEVEKIMEKSQAEAFVCVCDQVAANVMQGLAKMGIRVPEDIAVTGVDDDEQFRVFHTSPITTMRQPFTQLSRAAARLMLERQENPSMPPREMRFSCDLIVRASCGSKLRRQIAHVAR